MTERLREEYGSHQPRLNTHPTDSLLATILSQHTADRNSHAAFAALQGRYDSWEEIAFADETELANTIRCAGLGNLKARRIQEALRALEARFHTMDLGFLDRLPMDEARSILQSLPGVGPKTASCVLLFSCGRPALPVDTHVHRLARRLGLISASTSAEAAHDLLEAVVATEDVYDFHVNLVAHGRRVCHARNPECQVCILSDLCDFYGGGLATAQHAAPVRPA